MSDDPQEGIPLGTGGALTAESQLQFDPSLTKLRCLLAKPNWKLGWYLWLRSVLLLMPFTLCLYYFDKVTKPGTTFRKVTDVGWALLAIITFGIIHYSIRAWANRRYNLPLSGFLWWAFLWRFMLMYGATLGLVLFIFGGIALSYLAISALIHFAAPGGPGTKVVGTAGWFLGGLFASLGIAVVSAMTVTIPAYGMLAHRVIATHSRPEPACKWLQRSIRVVGLVTLCWAFFVLFTLIRELSGHASWLKLARLVAALAVTLTASVGLLRLRTWGRWAGILLLVYLTVLWTHWYTKKGVFPTTPELIFMGFILIPLLLLFLPAVRKTLQGNG